MDRIITNSGGQPLLVQDLSFLQDNIEQMGANIAALVCEGSSVLGGCEIRHALLGGNTHGQRAEEVQE